MKQIMDLVTGERPLRVCGIPVYLDESGMIEQAAIIISPEILEDMMRSQVVWWPLHTQIDAAKVLHLEKTGEPVDDDQHAIDLVIRNSPEDYD